MSLDIPGEGRFRHALQNAGHGLAFAALVFASLLSLGVRDKRRLDFTILVGGVSLALFLFGIGIEFAQQVVGRGASGADLLMNFNGIVAGSALAVSTRNETAGWTTQRQYKRIIALTLGSLALLWCLRLPIAIIVVDVLAPELPVLANFEQPLSLARLEGGWTPAKLALMQADYRWPNNNTTVLEASFPPMKWPGFRLVEPPGDWQGYMTLSMKAFNTTSRLVKLHLRVDQRAEGEDIFWSTSRLLDPGPNTILIALNTMHPDVKLDERRADHQPFLAVSQILIFLSENSEPVTLLFDDMMLVR